MLSKYASILWKYKSSLLTNILSKYTSILSKYKGILSNHTRILSSTKVYFQITQVYFQSTKVYSGSTKVYSGSTKIYCGEKNPKARLLRVLFDSIDLLALFGVYAGIIFTRCYITIISTQLFFCSTFFLKNSSTSVILIVLSFSCASFNVTALLPNPDLSKYILVLISCFELIYFSCFSPSRFTCGVLS